MKLKDYMGIGAGIGGIISLIFYGKPLKMIIISVVIVLFIGEIILDKIESRALNNHDSHKANH